MYEKLIIIDWLSISCNMNLEVLQNLQILEKENYHIKTDYLVELGANRIWRKNYIYFAAGMQVFIISTEHSTAKDKTKSMIKFSNELLYNENFNSIYDLIINVLKFTNIKINRIDLALDFRKLDNKHLTINSFLQKIVANEYKRKHQKSLKVNYSNSIINAITWGSHSSSIAVQFYNKSLEMRVKKKKLYIEELHKQIKGKTDVWRLEFRIKYNSLKTIENGKFSDINIFELLNNIEYRKKFFWSVFSDKFNIINKNNRNIKIFEYIGEVFGLKRLYGSDDSRIYKIILNRLISDFKGMENEIEKELQFEFIQDLANRKNLINYITEKL